MSQPLHAAPLTLTVDDARIWMRVSPAMIYGCGNRLWPHSVQSDVRDAQLMYEAQRERALGNIGWVSSVAPASADPYPYAGGVRLWRRGEWLAHLDFDGPSPSEYE